MSGFPDRFTVIKRAMKEVLLVAVMAITAPTAISATESTWPSAFEPAKPYVVRADFGGSVLKRLTDIDALRTSQRRIEIRGNVCLSSCTMLLGLSKTCVNTDTVFGFHGPSRNGTPLPEPLFNQVSSIISQYYPAAIRKWYMDVARHSLADIHTLTGAELISLGAAKPCAQTYAYAM